MAAGSSLKNGVPGATARRDDRLHEHHFSRCFVDKTDSYEFIARPIASGLTAPLYLESGSGNDIIIVGLGSNGDRISAEPGFDTVGSFDGGRFWTRRNTRLIT